MSAADDLPDAGLALYYHPLCPYCVRVLMGLRGLDVALRLHNVLTDPDRRRELIAGGGRATVPCLRIETEATAVRWMYESGDIVEYLQRRFAG